MGKLKELWSNKWVKFYVISIIYILWFIVWANIWWTILGLIFIYDYYISKNYRKLFWNKHLSLKEKNKSYRSIAGWVEALIFAVVVATLVRTYFVEMYVIPTPSMEKSLLIGDYLGVSKVAYGPKLPNTPLSFPFVHNMNPLNPEKKSYVEWIKRPYRRLLGLDTVERLDVVVFNYPEGDTVALIAPQASYYQLEREYGRKQIELKSKIISHPVDKRDNYVKRAVAIHGDKLEVKDGIVYVNDNKENDISGKQYRHTIITDGSAIPAKVFDDLGISKDDILHNIQNGIYSMPLTAENVEELKKLSNVKSVSRDIDNDVIRDIFPHDTLNYKWSADNFGPLVIPRKGTTVDINAGNISIYKRIIDVYEDNDLEIKGDDIFINGQKSDKYKFKMNYYFMMGDNRHNSLDSRYWGFVPEDHIVGKASFVWLSLDKNKSFPANIRFKRMFRSVK